MAHQAPLYPVSLVVAGKRCLVVGGGAVATHKVESLLFCGAEVTVVAPDVAHAIADLAIEHPLAIERRPYRSPEAADYRLVVTATGIPGVDHEVFADADAAGVWVNSADDVENCTFLLPALHRHGTVTVAVSTGGASPALAKWVRSRIGDVVGPDLAVLAELLDEARARVKASGRATSGIDWQALLEDHVATLVGEGKIEEARSRLRILTQP